MHIAHVAYIIYCGEEVLPTGKHVSGVFYSKPLSLQDQDQFAILLVVQHGRLVSYVGNIMVLYSIQCIVLTVNSVLYDHDIHYIIVCILYCCKIVLLPKVFCRNLLRNTKNK